MEFNKDQLYWIERTADIESANVMKRFTDFVQIDISELKGNEKELMKKIGSELIELYGFLKGLRNKCEYERNDRQN